MIIVSTSAKGVLFSGWATLAVSLAAHDRAKARPTDVILEVGMHGTASPGEQLEATFRKTVD